MRRADGWTGSENVGFTWALHRFYMRFYMVFILVLRGFYMGLTLFFTLVFRGFYMGFGFDCWFCMAVYTPEL